VVETGISAVPSTKNYDPKVFLLTKIKPEYSYILYNLTHFPGSLVWRIRQVLLSSTVIGINVKAKILLDHNFLLYVTGCRITQVPLYILIFPQSWRVQVVQVKNIQFVLHVHSKRIMIEMQSAYNIEKAGALHNFNI
jgi:hypothetical protein